MDRMKVLRAYNKTLQYNLLLPCLHYLEMGSCLLHRKGYHLYRSPLESLLYPLPELLYSLRQEAQFLQSEFAKTQYDLEVSFGDTHHDRISGCNEPFPQSLDHLLIL